MFGIGDFFKKVQSSYTKELFIRTCIIEAIKETVHIDVPIAAVAFKGSVVTLNNTSQSLKSAVFIKKQSILKKINEKQQIRAVTDLR